MKPINLVKGRLDRAYDNLRDQTEEEIRYIELDQVDRGVMMEVLIMISWCTRRIDATLLSLDQLSSMQQAFEGVPSPVARE